MGSNVRKETSSAIGGDIGEGGSSWQRMEGVGDVGKGTLGSASHLNLLRALSIERLTWILLLVEASCGSVERDVG